MMRNLLLLVALVPALVSAFSPFHACPQGDRPLPHEVRIPGCTVAPCSAAQGAVINVQIDFSALPAGASLLRPEVWLHILGAHINFPLSPEEQIGCDFLTGAACPLPPNGFATFYMNIPVPTFLLGSLAVEVSVYDHNNHPVFCGIMDVFISPA